MTGSDNYQTEPTLIASFVSSYNLYAIMEDVESKPLLLVEVVEDPSDKSMPYKLRLNKQTLECLMPSSERYVRSRHVR